MIRFYFRSGLFLLACLFLIQPTIQAQDAKEILRKAEDNFRGSSSIGEIKMTIVRPSWTREFSMKFWNKGEEYSLMLLTAPVRDKGTSFLKRNKEIWNWQPSIDRVIKLPPSMMMQSWMGSDFTNDDLVKSSSTLNDYTQKVTGEEEIEGRMCYVLELIPNEDAPIVWGKIKTWIDKESYLQLRSEFYDEDDYLVNTLTSSNLKMMDGRLIPTKMEVIPEEDQNNKTIIEYVDIQFDKDIKDSFFSVQNMKRIR